MDMSEADVRAKVEHFVTKNFAASPAPGDGLRITYGSTAVVVSVHAGGSEHGAPAVVRVAAPVAVGTPQSPAVFGYVARHSDSWLFGHLSLECHDDEAVPTCDVNFVHRLLGSYLDEQELVAGVIAVLGVADQIDDDFVAQFGGRRWADAPS